MTKKIIFTVDLTNTITVVLQAPDSVLIERAAGKRIDTTTGGNFIEKSYYST